MNIHDFNYFLPDELIAQYPTPEREGSRLLVVRQTERQDAQFGDLIDLLTPNDCLIFNNTRVMRARLYGQKPTGGKVECLIERLLTDTLALCHLKASKALKPGAVIQFGSVRAIMDSRQDDLFVLRLEDTDWLTLMDSQGEIPLPPYMERDPELADDERYQTVYSQHLGAVAAPTAGLHFSDALLKRIEAKGVATGYVTLHVGAGTFLPMRVDNVHEHVMHKEWLSVSESTVELIHATRARGGRVIAVGTTTVRALETAAQSGTLKPFEGDTQIFIYPGYQFHAIDAMITNFHLPKSTLLLLVSAFAGKETILNAYAHAVAERYRFFSYGDAMYLERLTSHPGI